MNEMFPAGRKKIRASSDQCLNLPGAVNYCYKPVRSDSSARAEVVPFSSDLS